MTAGRGLVMVAVLAGMAPGAAAAQGGVATFVMRGEHGERSDTVVQQSRGKNLRMEGLGGKNTTAFIVNESGSVIIADAARKTAMVMTREDQEKMKALTEGMMAGKDRSDREEPKAEVTRTGRTETVAGVRCDVFHVVSEFDGKSREGEACIGDVGLAIFQVLASNPMFRKAAPNNFDQYRKMVGEGKGLVKATTIENGKRIVSLELIRLDRTVPPASAFETPAGYTVQSMGAMMGKAAGAMEQLQKLRAKPKVP